MKLPNAARGVKKIFSAEILKLIAVICLIVAVSVFVIGAAAVSADAQGADAGLTALAGTTLIIGIVLFVAFGVLALISFILNLVGIINAGKDEPNFKSALLFLIMGMVAAGISAFTASTNGMLSSLMMTLYNLMDLFVYIFVVSGCVRMADRLNRGDVSAKGSNILKLLIVVQVLSLTASLISSFMGGNFASVTAGILALVALVLTVIQYIMYLSFLAKAKKMLAEA